MEESATPRVPKQVVLYFLRGTLGFAALVFIVANPFTNSEGIWFFISIPVLIVAGVLYSHLKEDSYLEPRTDDTGNNWNE